MANVALVVLDTVRKDCFDVHTLFDDCHSLAGTDGYDNPNSKI